MRMGVVLAVALIAAGCARETGPPADQEPPRVAKPEEPATVSGVVRWTGDPIEPSRIVMTGDSFLAGAWPDGGPPDPRFEVAADGGLPHVFVWATKGPFTDRTWDPPSTSAEVVATRGLHRPHVLGVMIGQSLRLRSGANETCYCFHARPKVNDAFNVAVPSGTEKTVAFTKPEKGIPVADDCYSWMWFWIFVLDHPFFATTDASGRFAIRGLPPGDYVFKVWHESMTVDAKAHEAETKVTLASGATESLDFELR
jgi:Carboxypeptidase regulatory-like domain